MKYLKYLPIILFIFIYLSASGQSDSLLINKTENRSNFTIEPAIGINLMPAADLLLSNLVQWNMKKYLAVVSRTSVSYNSAFARNFNYVQTNYNTSVSQTFGIGIFLSSKRSTDFFALMAGIKYNATKETLNNPDYEKVSVASNTVSPDFGLMYAWKLGKKKYFFTYRAYLPLYPYPFKTFDLNAIDGNFKNFSLEFGVGIRLK